jgi:amino acid adenylation domain-containing protein
MKRHKLCWSNEVNAMTPSSLTPNSTPKAPLSAAKRALLAQRLQGQIKPVQPTIPRRPPGTTIPLSFSQQRLWFLEQLEPGNPLYNIPFALQLQGHLNLPALEWAFSSLIQRHEILRTTVVETSEIVEIPTTPLTTQHSTENPVYLQQRVHPSGAIAIQQHDLTYNSDPMLTVERIAQKEAQQPFDLRRGPLLRVTLLTLAPTKFILLVTLHHLISDAWSTGILVRELGTLYLASVQGKVDPLLPLPIQYGDFALWQRRTLQGDRLQEYLDYWQQQFATIPSILQLPTDRPRPAIQSSQGDRYTFTFSPELTQALKTLSQNADATLFMTLLAAFKVLLYRYTGQSDIVVGSPIANRNRAATEGLIGFFVNTLALRSQLDEESSFQELLRHIREVTLGAFEHQDLPFERLIDQLQLSRDLSHTPLFQVMFILQNAPTHPLQLPGLTITPLDFGSKTAKFDLTLILTETEGYLTGGIEYNTDLFDRSTIVRFCNHFQRLLDDIVTNPQQRLSQFSILTAVETTLLQQWNQTTKPYALEDCLHQRIEAQVTKTPEAIAVTFEYQHLTYAELNQRANQLAHYLQSQGVGPDVLVGVCLERSLDMVVALLGILKAGGAYLPLDPVLPPERLVFMVTDAQAPLILTQPELIATLPTNLPVVGLDSPAIAQAPATNPVNYVTPDNLAYVIYTSGSTGKPKGAMNTHRGICNRLHWMQAEYKLTTGDRILQKTPFSFDVSVWEFFWPLMTGASLHIAQPGGHKDSHYLVRTIAAAHITTLHFVPSMLQAFLEAPGLESCTSLRQVFCSGETLSTDLQDRFWAKFSSHEGTEPELHNLYGPTEAAIDVTYWHCQRPASDDSQGRAAQTVPIGRAIANTQVHILDPALNPVPIGVPGEIYLGGLGLARGYYRRPGLTAERFVPNPFPFQTGERLYRTGDLGRYRLDGEIEFLGRCDFQVKIRGFRIELGEIEARLRQHPHVREAIAMARTDRPGQQQLVAYLTPSTPTPTENPIKDLRHWLQRQLPEYMIPTAFVWLDHFPLNSNGKVDRRALPAPDVEQVERSRVNKPFTAPRSPIETQLATIWSQVLGISTISIDDNFFELGGDSILSLQVIAQANQLGLQLTPKHLFQHQTIRTLATAVEAAPTHLQTTADFALTSNGPVAQLNPAMRDRLLAENPALEDCYPLSPVQNGILFHSLYAPGDGLYITQMCYRLQGKLDTEALRQTWQRVCDRHPILRTAFVWEGLPQPLQLVQKQVPLPWQLEDWRSLTPAQQDIELMTLLDRDRTTGFQLTTAPLMRLTVVQLADDTHEVIWSFHHLLLDGWSLPLIFQEVFTLYDGLRQGYTPELGDRPPYRNYLAWLENQDLDSAAECWRPLLQGFRVPTPLPKRSRLAVAGENKQPGSEQTSVPRLHTLSLTESMTAALQAFGRHHHLTLNTLVQGVWAVFLSHISATPDIVFGATTAGRPPDLPGADQMIGLFINTLPVRVQVPSQGDRLTWLQDLQTQQSQARQYEYTPLSQIQRWSDVPQGTPLFESIIVFENYPIDAALKAATAKKGQFSLAIPQVRSVISNSYPLTLRALPGSQLTLQILSDRTAFSVDSGDRWLQQLVMLLQGLLDQPNGSLGDWQAQLTAFTQQQQQQQAETLAQSSIQKLRRSRRKVIRSDHQEV